MRQKSKEELRIETKEKGQLKPIADSDATLRTLSTPNNYSILIENGTEKGTTLDIAFKFTKENFKIEGKPESGTKLSLSIPPGGVEFILFEKVDRDAQSKIKFSFQYSTAMLFDSDEKVVTEIMRNSETNPPLRIEYKKKMTEVYMHTLNTKDSIYFLWENKTPLQERRASEANEQAKEIGILKKKVHKHRHRDR